MVIATVATRFLLTFLGAMLFGLQRQRQLKPTGFGTFTFVSIGACALAIIGMDLVPDNPVVLMSAIVSSIGFLGAGALIKGADRVQGFTTAASIWGFAIFGLTMGAGELLIAGYLYAYIWLVVGLDYIMELRGIGVHQRRLRVTFVGASAPEDYLQGRVRKAHVIEARSSENTLEYLYQIQATRRQLAVLPESLRKDKAISAYALE